jgi:hypothetical protein
MTYFRFIFLSTMLALFPLTSAAGHAIDTPTLTQQAQQAASKGENSLALGLYELALTQSAGQPEAVFGPLDGQYWQLIAKTDDFPRARNFFNALAAEQTRPNATLLANKASAIGGYFGWLHQNNLMDSVPPSTLQQMDATARASYDQALALDPDNFSALYGYAIYESYNPNGKAHMQQLLAKLDTLRSFHPQWPWQMVDHLEKHGHPQQ